MLSRWFGRELSAEEKTKLVESVRAQFEGEDLSDATLRRFCVAREWDEKATVEMLKEHLKWRKETLPIERSAEIDRVMESGRIRALRRGKNPIILVDFMWGQFLLDEFTEDQIIKAQFYLLEDVLAEADALCPADEPAQYIAVSTGGPPPTPFIRKISPLFDINYPERCASAIIYPIPRWMKYVADAILLILPKRTREKFLMYAEEEQLLEKTGLTADELPEDLKGGIDASRERREKAMANEKTWSQLPDEFKDAVTKADTDVQVMMSMAAC